MGQPRHVIPMPMRQNNKIQLGEINIFRLYVRCEDVAIIACVE